MGSTLCQALAERATGPAARQTAPQSDHGRLASPSAL